MIDAVSMFFDISINYLSDVRDIQGFADYAFYSFFTSPTGTTYRDIECFLAKERAPARVDLKSKYPEKHPVTVIKNEEYLRGRGPCFFASCFSCSTIWQRKTQYLAVIVSQ